MSLNQSFISESRSDLSKISDSVSSHNYVRLSTNEKDFFLIFIGATSRENLSAGVSDQVRLKPVCSTTETS